SGWRMDLLPVHVDDALDRTHQETLHLGVVLGDDHKTVGEIIQRWLAGGQSQINDGNGAPTDVCHPTHHPTGFWQHGKPGALQHFLYLEHVDAIQLSSVETEQQELQAVLSDQLGALVNRIQYSGHAQTP